MSAVATLPSWRTAKRQEVEHVLKALVDAAPESDRLWQSACGLWAVLAMKAVEQGEYDMLGRMISDAQELTERRRVSEACS
jgi:hypothetical protein